MTKFTRIRVGEIALWLTALFALPEDPHSEASISPFTNNLQLQFPGTDTVFWPPWALTYMYS